MELESVLNSHEWISTNEVPRIQRDQFWLEQIQKQVIHIDCKVGQHDEIEASLRHLDFGLLRINQIRANAHSVQRSQADITQDNKHSVFICFMLSGYGFSYQGTQCAHHSAGDIILYDTLIPYGHGFPDHMEMVVVDLPDSIACQYLKSWNRGNLVHLPSDTRFIDSSVSQLFSILNIMLSTSPNAAHESKLAFDMLENLAALMDNLCSDRRDIELWRQCQSLIQQNLQDEELSSSLLAKELNISTRKLQRIFSDNGFSVQNFIWLKRLEQCRADILCPAFASRNVSEIAFKWGFNDAAHFSRRYKARYGESPAQTRNTIKRAF